jgi:hypothetical protein
MTVAQIRETAKTNGVHGWKGWNISASLSALTGQAIRTDQGWELTDTGRAAAAALTGNPVVAVASPLRQVLGNLQNADVKAFVQEAIGCIESGYFRAAVVLTWVGALGVLYDHVIARALAAFNAEARRRFPTWREARKADDLARMKEYDFLQVLEAISVIGKTVKQELEGCLKLRNGCGHPNSFKIAQHRVSSHVETLVLNVFAVFW